MSDEILLACASKCLKARPHQAHISYYTCTTNRHHVQQMPRISPSLIRQARLEHPLIPLLLRVCHDIPSARNELRWLQEHARDNVKTEVCTCHGPAPRHQSLQFKTSRALGAPVLTQIKPLHMDLRKKSVGWKDARVQTLLFQNVKKRAKGMPLQYILGDQPFGELEILCQPHVLIPRSETEMYTEKVARLLLSALTSPTNPLDAPVWQRRKKFRILDLCTGTGCIALLLHSILRPVNSSKGIVPPDLDVEILGIDKSTHAVNLARKNLSYNVSKGLLHPSASDTVSFQNLDVLALADNIHEHDRSKCREIRRTLNTLAASTVPAETSFDMVITNPPYVSHKDYAPGGKTEPSVRMYEPIEALVPPVLDPQSLRSSSAAQGDMFYMPLMRVAQAVNAQLFLAEVGDSAQAARVCELLLPNIMPPTHGPEQARGRLETWKDDGSVRTVTGIPTHSTPDAIYPHESGGPEISDRAVVAWFGHLEQWCSQALPALAPEFAKEGADQTPARRGGTILT